MTLTTRNPQIHPVDIRWPGVLDSWTRLGKYLFSGSVALLVVGFAACGFSPATETPAAKFKIPYTCIHRALDPCIAAEEFAKRVLDRSNGQVDIQITSFLEMGIFGEAILPLVEDGTLGMVEVYRGYVGGKLAILEMDNLWGMYQDYDTQMKVTEAIKDDMDRIVEEKFGVVVVVDRVTP